MIVGISGATGIVYGPRLLEMLRELEIETHLVMTKAGERTLAYETGSHATRWAQNGQLPPSYGPGTPAPQNACSP